MVAKVVARLLAAAICIVAAPAFALDPGRPVDSYAVETWDTDDGLPHNLVQAIAQTPNGYLWFGTWEGLARFNAWEFRVFDADHDGVLANSGVRALTLAPDGALWIGTSEGGLSRFADGQWKKFGVADGLRTGAIRSLLAAKDGRIWIGTEEDGVIVYDGKAFLPLDAQLPHGLVLSLYEAHDGSMWIGTLRGLAHWKGGKLVDVPPFPGGATHTIHALEEGAQSVMRFGTEKGLYRLNGNAIELETDDTVLATDSISAIRTDRDGNLWVGTFQSGLARVRDRKAEMLTQKDGLPHNRVAALLEDHEGSVWVGTGVGLARLADAPFITVDTRRGLSDAYVRSVAEDSSGAIWVGSGNGLNRGAVGGRYQAFYPGGVAAVDSIMSVYPAAAGGVWFGTRDAGLGFYDGTSFKLVSVADGLAGRQVRSLRETRDGNLWVGTSAGLSRLAPGPSIPARKITNFGTAEGLPRAYVMSLFEDKDGALWAGTSQGVAVLEHEHFRNLAGAPNAPKADVFDFHQDDDGGIWIATSAGLYRYRNGRFAEVKGKPGELPHQVFAILEDDMGFLWLSSNAGIYRANRAVLDAIAEGRADRVGSTRYGHRDGMASNQCNGSSQPAGWRAHDGRLWFATAGGAVSVDPHHADVGAVQPPPIVVERVSIDGDAPPKSRDFDVAPDARRVTFEYAALAYRRPEHVNYRFRLVGFESDWVAVGPRRSTVFTNLPPGEYRFEVEPDEEFPGFPPVTASVPFKVLPHFYEKPWFIVLAAIALVAFAVSVYRWRVQRLMKRKLQLEAQVEERTHALADETRKLSEANEQTARLLETVREQSEAFARLSREDSLTGLPNRRHFDDWMRTEFLRCRHEQRPISAAVLDIDDFKRVNDTYTHAVGDEVLRTIAEQLRRITAGLGMPARYGGDELVIGFPGISAEVAATCCEKLRESIATYPWNRIAAELAVTISVGVSDREDAFTHERLIAFADGQLYESKKLGRNRVTFNADLESSPQG